MTRKVNTLGKTYYTGIPIALHLLLLAKVVLWGIILLSLYKIVLGAGALILAWFLVPLGHFILNPLFSFRLDAPRIMLVSFLLCCGAEFCLWPVLRYFNRNITIVSDQIMFLISGKAPEFISSFRMIRPDTGKGVEEFNRRINELECCSDMPWLALGHLLKLAGSICFVVGMTIFLTGNLNPEPAGYTTMYNSLHELYEENIYLPTGMAVYNEQFQWLPHREYWLIVGAKAFLKQKNRQAAYEACLKAYKKRPDDYVTNFYLAKVMLDFPPKHRDPGLMLKCASRAAELKPCFKTFELLARTYQAVGQHEKAMDTARKALKVCPSLKVYFELMLRLKNQLNSSSRTASV